MCEINLGVGVAAIVLVILLGLFAITFCALWREEAAKCRRYEGYWSEEVEERRKCLIKNEELERRLGSAARALDGKTGDD